MRRFTWLPLWCAAALVALVPLGLRAQVTTQRLAAAASEPQNWFMYSGNYFSTRYSPLNQITPANVKDLKLQWAYQAPVAGTWQTTPLVVDGVMYITQRLNDVVALDAATGRAFWVYRYTPAPDRIACCGANNRGLAILGDTLFMGTLDAKLIAIDVKSGRPIWQTEVARTTDGYSITLAPLVVKDKVIIGVGGGEYGIRGFIAAYDAATGNSRGQTAWVQDGRAGGAVKRVGLFDGDDRVDGTVHHQDRGRDARRRRVDRDGRAGERARRAAAQRAAGRRLDRSLPRRARFDRHRSRRKARAADARLPAQATARRSRQLRHGAQGAAQPRQDE